MPSPSTQISGAMYTPSQTYELLNRMNSQGLGAVYRFTRTTCIYSTTMVAVEVTFTNNSDAVIQSIQVGE